MNKKVFLW